MGNQDDAAARSGFALTAIQVDIDGLADFRSLLSRELDANLRPGSHEILNQHLMGPRFGVGNPGIGTTAARERYTELLKASTENLGAYVRIADVLIDALGDVVERFRGADGAAGVTLSQLYVAVAHALQGQPVSGSDPTVESNRESHRLYG